MSYYEPYHTCTYKTVSLDELRLKSLLRRSEGLRSLDKAFEEAQNKIQEQVESRNSAIELRLSQLEEIKQKAEEDARKITPYKIKSEFKAEPRFSRLAQPPRKSKNKSPAKELVVKKKNQKTPEPEPQPIVQPKKDVPKQSKRDAPNPVSVEESKKELDKTIREPKKPIIKESDAIKQTEKPKEIIKESEKPKEKESDIPKSIESELDQLNEPNKIDDSIAPSSNDSNLKPENPKSKEVESNKEPETFKVKESEFIKEKHDCREPEVIEEKPKSKEPEVIQEIPKSKESEVIQEIPKSEEPKIIEETSKVIESEAIPKTQETDVKEESVGSNQSQEKSSDPKKSLSTELPKEEVKEPLPTTEEPSVVHNAMPETPLDPQTESKQNKSKPPELNIVPSDPNQPDKIHQILDTDEVLDPMSKTLSPFEQNLVSFGQHFNFIPSPEPEKWPEEEEEVSAEAAEEQESILEEEELTPYQAALKKKYEEEVCTTKTASWGGDKPRNKFDMSYLNVNQGEEIIHGNLFTQFVDWIRALKEEEIGDKALKEIKSHQNNPVSKDCTRIDPYAVFKDRTDLNYTGEKNTLAMPHGDGEVNFQNGDVFKGEFLNGERHGKGSLVVSTRGENNTLSSVAAIEGTYVKDHLEGPAKIVHKNGNIQHAFCSKGCLHGVSKLFDKDYNIIEMGWYHSGQKDGHFWRFLTGGSLLVGGVTATGKIGGDDVIYIYPDFKTCLKGTFVEEEMLLGQACYVEIAIKKKDIYFIKTTTPMGPNYKYDPSTKERLCELDPLLPDPYEYNCVYIKQSRMKNSGEGIFAIKDFYKGEIVSFYNGIRMRSDDLDSKSDEWEKNAYKIMDLLGKDENGIEGVIDLPAEFISTDKYRASLSHKANHSFEPNAKFILFHHARFGLVPSLIITAEAVAHDKEITVSYDYAMDDSPPWYQDLYTQNMLDMYQESKNFEG